MIYCAFLLESPRWGDSYENTQHTFMLKKSEHLSVLCLLMWRYDKYSLARTSPVSNLISWFQKCKSHWSSTVFTSTICQFYVQLSIIHMTMPHGIISRRHALFIGVYATSRHTNTKEDSVKVLCSDISQMPAITAMHGSHSLVRFSYSTRFGPFQ